MNNINNKKLVNLTKNKVLDICPRGCGVGSSDSDGGAEARHRQLEASKINKFYPVRGFSGQ